MGMLYSSILTLKDVPFLLLFPEHETAAFNTVFQGKASNLNIAVLIDQGRPSALNFMEYQVKSGVILKIPEMVK